MTEKEVLIQILDRNFGYTEEEKAEIVADRLLEAGVCPVKRGHWVKRMKEHTTPKYTSFTPIWSCSECGLDYDPALAPRVHFCYNCGADLREYDHKREE